MGGQTMSFGSSPGDRAWGDEKLRKLTSQADAARAAREAGYKSPLRRLLGRLRPHRKEPGGAPQSNHGTSDDPGH